MRRLSWMHSCHVFIQTVSVREVFLAQLAHISLDAGVRGEMVVVIGPNRVALTAHATEVPRKLLMYVLHVFRHSTATHKCALALRTPKAPARVSRLYVVQQLTAPPTY